jgi:hypothetical protein
MLRGRSRAVAQLERTLLAERTKAGMRTAAIFVPFHRPPFGHSLATRSARADETNLEATIKFARGQGSDLPESFRILVFFLAGFFSTDPRILSPKQ